MEHDGIYGNVLSDLTRFEGTYTFHAKATFGGGCSATRETFWSVSVEPSIDPERSDVRLEPGSTPGTGRIVFTPRDRFGNPLGPGRPDLFEVFPTPGTNIDTPVRDNRDGSYEIGVSWGGATAEPGVLVQQPDRAAVPLAPPSASGSPSASRQQGCRHILTGVLLVVVLIAFVVILWLVLR